MRASDRSCAVVRSSGAPNGQTEKEPSSLPTLHAIGSTKSKGRPGRSRRPLASHAQTGLHARRPLELCATRPQPQLQAQSGFKSGSGSGFKLDLAECSNRNFKPSHSLGRPFKLGLGLKQRANNSRPIPSTRWSLLRGLHGSRALLGAARFLLLLLLLSFNSLRWRPTKPQCDLLRRRQRLRRSV